MNLLPTQSFASPSSSSLNSHSDFCSSDTQGFYFYGSCLDGIGISDVGNLKDRIIPDLLSFTRVTLVSTRVSFVFL